MSCSRAPSFFVRMIPDKGALPIPLLRVLTDRDTEYCGNPEHQGRWCYGKTPMCTFLDSLELAREKFIPH